MDSRPLTSDDGTDLNELFNRLRRGLVMSLGLAFLGLALAAIVSLATTNRQFTQTTLRVTFGFPGFEKGEYPNGTKFQPDDLRAPDVVNEAVKRLGAKFQTPELASKIRGALTITGLVSPNIVKERDRLRAAGQTLAPYFSDEYEISLTLPRGDALNLQQREMLLTEIVNAYLGKFRRTYVELPPQFGNAFHALKNADFVEYELILTKETQALSAFLEQQVEDAKQFRSATTNLSFQDLLKQTEIFSQTRLNDVLGLVYINGLSKDRTYAMVKMDYHMRTLEDQEQRLTQEAEVVSNLLAKTQERAQNYVVATRGQQSPGLQPIVDQGFIDTLLANDAYNFLVRRALDAGLALKRVQSDIQQLKDRRQRMQSFMQGESTNQSAIIAETQKALAGLESSYRELLEQVRATLEDYSAQEYADAVRISMQAKTQSILKSLLLAAAIGFGIGLSLGVGLSLLRPVRTQATA